MRRRALSAGLITVLIATLVGFFATPASARLTWERDIAKAGSHKAGPVIQTARAAALWHADGDVWWVEDRMADGYAAEARWEEYTFNGDGWVLHRHGACVNGLGARHWGACNKDYWEHNAYVDWRACAVTSSGVLHGCSDWTAASTASTAAVPLGTAAPHRAAVQR